MAQSDELLTVEQAAGIVGCTPAKMSADLCRGVYPGTKPGRSWVIPRVAFFARINEIAIEQAAKRRKPVVTAVSGSAGKRKALLTLP